MCIHCRWIFYDTVQARDIVDVEVIVVQSSTRRAMDLLSVDTRRVRYEHIDEYTILAWNVMRACMRGSIQG
jgi:hypothetical protein